MSCDRYTGAIVDHACGAEIAADAVAHLRSCAACRRTFDEQRQALQDIDRELESALAIEPSERFVAETLARVDRSSPRWRGVVWWSVPAAAAILILVALGASQLRENRPADRHQPPAAPTGSLAATPERTPSEVPPAPNAGRPPRVLGVRHRSERTTVAAREREKTIEAAVVVPPDQSRAIERYLTLVRRGALDTSPLANPQRAGAAPPTELVIAPLSVEALTIADGHQDIGPGVDRR